MKRRSSKAGDTLHPKALARDRERQLHHQMKKIIRDGERIRRHLVTLRAEVGEPGGDTLKLDLEQLGATASSPRSEESSSRLEVEEPRGEGSSPRAEESCPRVLRKDAEEPPRSPGCREVEEAEEATDSGNVTEGSDAGAEGSDAGLEEEARQPCSGEAPAAVAQSAERAEEVDQQPADVIGLIEMLEKLHRINAVLESKEEQMLAMRFECDALTEGASVQEAPHPTFGREVSEYREVNAALLRRIADNSSLLRGMKEEGEERRREVARLEFDVNVIERESKRLQLDLEKVESIGMTVTRPNHLTRGAVTDVAVSAQERRAPLPAPHHRVPPPSNSPLEAVYGRLRSGDGRTEAGDGRVEEVYGRVGAGEGRVASPPGSSRGSDKSVRFNDQEDVLRFSSSASSSSLSPPPLLLPILSPRSILKCVKGGYGSDSGSDTGVSSLSSMQGDYELSTLV